MVAINDMITYSMKTNDMNIGKPYEFNIDDYINEVPLLMSDSGSEEEEELGQGGRSGSRSGSGSRSKPKPKPKSKPGPSAKSSPESSPESSHNSKANASNSNTPEPFHEIVSGGSAIVPPLPLPERLHRGNVTKYKLTSKQFKQERNQLMLLTVKYVALKINNLFPSDCSGDKIPLETFLITIVNRLNLSLTTFLKSVIYLFRYMDIIYLLRYLNQSNNFANYTEMDFPLRKLLIGCVKLSLLRDHHIRNWPTITGLSNNDINVIIKAIIKRLNNKVNIKPVEVTRFKLEILRYIKMTSNEI